MQENNQESRRERSQRINQESIKRLNRAFGRAFKRVFSHAQYMLHASVRDNTRTTESMSKKYKTQRTRTAHTTTTTTTTPPPTTTRTMQRTTTNNDENNIKHNTKNIDNNNNKNKNDDRKTHANDDNNKNTPSGLTSVFSCPDASCMLGAQLRHGTGHCQGLAQAVPSLTAKRMCCAMEPRNGVAENARSTTRGWRKCCRHFQQNRQLPSHKMLSLTGSGDSRAEAIGVSNVLSLRRGAWVAEPA